MNAPEFLTHTLPYIDTLYDYGAFLSRTGGHLGTLPAQCARDARIAIGELDEREAFAGVDLDQSEVGL